MHFHALLGHATKFILVHKSETDFADLYLKLVELKKATPLDILKLTATPEEHTMEVVVAPTKELNYKSFFTSLGFSILSARTVSTARPILQGEKTVEVILPAIAGLHPEDVEVE